MAVPQVFEQDIQIRASATAVERCFTELALLHRWLNPALRCEPVGEAWTTELGGRCRFVLQVPLLRPALSCTVIEREPGTIVWEFAGFFQGRDRWVCEPNASGTHLYNRFEFAIPNPLVAWGFETFAARWTRTDMESQLRRLKQVAEETYRRSGF